MEEKQFLSENFRWEWRTPLLLAICLVPSVLVTIFANPRMGVGVVVGLIPAVFQGVDPVRKKRVSVLVLGLLLPLSLFVGTLLKIYAGMWLSALALGLLGFGAVRFSTKHPAVSLGTVMVVPAVGIGLSYDAFSTPMEVFITMVCGSLLACGVALLFPEYTPSAEHRNISPQKGVVKPPPPESHLSPQVFSLLFAAALATSVLVGFHWDHTGWVVGTTGFVMRPSGKMQKYRSVWRVVSILVGAAAASLVLTLQPGGLLTVGLAGLAMIAAGGLRQSRAYIMPAFTTFVIFLLILYPAQDATAVWGRFFERVGWVAVGVLIACFYGLLLPWLYEKIKKPAGQAQK